MRLDGLSPQQRLELIEREIIAALRSRGHASQRLITLRVDELLGDIIAAEIEIDYGTRARS
jgi:hypothetical protein